MLVKFVIKQIFICTSTCIVTLSAVMKRLSEAGSFTDVFCYCLVV